MERHGMDMRKFVVHGLDECAVGVLQICQRLIFFAHTCEVHRIPARVRGKARSGEIGQTSHYLQ